MTPETENPPRAGGGLVILHPDGTETRSGQYRDDAIRAADEALRDAATELEWRTAAHVALMRDAARDDDEADLDVLESQCALLEAEATLGRAHVAVQRLRRGGE